MIIFYISLFKDIKGQINEHTAICYLMCVPKQKNPQPGGAEER